MNYENISAISTAPLAAGVAIIRISGDSPLDIAEKMFVSKTPVKSFEPYKMYVGTIDCGSVKDYGMCVYFKAPKSYTGEEMVEFHCHGGVAISRAVLKRTIELGARLAERGEFTRRAFLNGKMSLSSCEGLVDMIYAQSESEAKMGFYLYKEKLFNKIKGVQDKLKYVLALIDANIDYPEEDIAFAESETIKNTLISCKNELVPLVESFKNSSKASAGVNVAICGRPNAGKSSLLNAVIGMDKAIVTSIEGTTRDVVEGERDINGVRFNFYDTAGIRESDNEIEKIGISKSKEVISKADIVLLMIDGAVGVTDEDKRLIGELGEKPHIIAVNKSDTDGFIDGRGDIDISAITGENLNGLYELLFEKAGVDTINFEGDFLTEQRHFAAISAAIKYLDTALTSLRSLPLDVVASDIKDAWVSLGKISGETCDEDVINEIFSKFCVGK
ncbi:MAG: tRNA uridine-5-carboxymethylaminomethyl(34) synthesis GTPase MnmE [Clostridia bacterium]|nr:tRNA uridine-5-carboxymethylaminomethyl(34) synthesis GTPase MnmE [Clostridia bacterium]